MEKLDQLIDSHTLGRLPEADQGKYQQQDDGTYRLIGDPTPTVKDEGALPLVVTSEELTELPELIRGYYTDKYKDINGNPGKEGTWKLRGYEDVSALKNAVGHVRAERDMAREKLKQYDGFDADEFKQLKEMKSRLEREKDLQRTEFDRQFTEASEQYKTEIRLRDERLQQLQESLKSAMIDGQAVVDISAAGGSPELLLPHIQGRAKLQEVDGRHVAVILGEDGKPRLRKGATQATDFLGIRDYVEELRDDKRFAGAFSGTGSSGSGAQKGRDVDGHAGAPAQISKHDMRAIAQWTDAIIAGKTKVV